MPDRLLPRLNAWPQAAARIDLPFHPYRVREGGSRICFVQDPDGNNVEAVYHGPVERSAPSVVLRW